MLSLDLSKPDHDDVCDNVLAFLSPSYFCLLGNPFNICLEEYQSFLLFLLLDVLSAVSL